MICLLPASLFKFRFFSTNSIPHERYYYLASVGMCFGVVALLSMLWTSSRKRTLCRTGAALVLFLICLGEIITVKVIERKWEAATLEYKRFISVVEEKLDELPGYSTCVIEDPLISYSYVKAALRLERPHWRIEQGKGGVESAQAYKPCLYMQFIREGTGGGARMRLYEVR